MGDWEDFCSSNGKGMDWEPWNEPGWADEGKGDDYSDVDAQEEYILCEEELEMDEKERNKSIIILNNLLERACANKKDFTKMEKQAIEYAISVLSEQSSCESGVDTEHTISCWGQPQKRNDRELNPPPMDFDDDIPF